MMLYGLPQPLTGSEIIIIQQTQNGYLAECSMPISEFLAWMVAQLPSVLGTTEPSASGIAWNNHGVISIS
jgi:hypothetical protein